MTRRLRCLVDMDGILADFLQGVWDEVLIDHDIVGDTDNVTDFYAIETGIPLEHREVVGDINRYFRREHFFEYLSPMEGAQWAMRQLVEAGHEVVVVSSPCTPWSASEKIVWLSEHFPFLDQKKVFIGHDKYMIVGDVFIDDAPRNAQPYKNVWPKSFVCSLGYTYNKNCKAYDLLVDRNAADAWQQILDGIKDFAS